MDYLKILESSYQDMLGFDQCLDSKLEYLSDYIFDFTTYDGEMAEVFATKALEVCKAITEKTTFEYIENNENRKWFLIMVNMPFFANKIDWGTSIRGCWWETYKGISLESCGLFIGDEQQTTFEFNEQQWTDFMAALQDFITHPQPKAGKYGEE